MIHCRNKLRLAACLLLVAMPAAAQWPADPALNLSLADGLRTQVVPHCAATADGGCYTGWYDSPGYGDYQVRLQRLTADGEEMFPHNGLLVSDHPSDTWVTDWTLITDRDDNAILAFADIRGGDFDLYVYKIDPAGQFLWGTDGIALTDNGQFFGFPSVTEAGNGDIVVVWPEGSMNTVIMMQRLTPAGAKLLGEDGMHVAGQSGRMAYAAKVIPADGDNVIVAWSPDYNYEADRQIAAQKFDPAGAALWPAEAPVFDTGMMPMGSYFDVAPDGAGGILLAWTSAEEFAFNCRLQHLTTAGAELFPHNGLDAFPGSEFEMIYPALNRDPATGELWVFCRAQDESQFNWGLAGQKLAPDGTCLWGAAGRVLMAVEHTFYSLPRAVLVPGQGAMFFVVTGMTYPADEDRIVAGLVDPAGDFVWPDETVTLASTLSDKLNLWALPGADGSAVAIWEDRRNDGGDVLGQNIRVDGSLGPEASPVGGEPAAPSIALAASPNPFNPGTTLRFETEAPGPVILKIYSVDGRLVRTLVDDVRGAGTQEEYWDGRNDAGRLLSSGVYLATLAAGDRVETGRLVLLK